MDWIDAVILIVSGMLAGFINVMAGGGSVISLSVLLMMGLPANVANGTNRIAIVLQNIAATSSFHAQQKLDVKRGLWLALPAVAGAIVGAVIAADVDQGIIEKAIGVVLLFMLFFILYKPQRWLQEQLQLTSQKVSFTQMLVFFFIGVYGGFIQVGVGYFLLAGLVLNAGYELVKANALKVFIVLLYTPLAIVVFVLNNQVDWLYGITLAVGTVMGGVLGTRLAVSKGAGFVRWIIVVVIILMSLKLFGIIDFQAFLGNLI